MTSITNPWSGIYKILAGRDKRVAPQTTLKQKDGTLTTNLQETIQHMLQILTTEDNQADDTEMQKNTQALAQEDNDMDDKEITVQVVMNVVMSMGKNKAPGEKGIPSEVFKSVVEILPRYMTSIYNGCLHKETFPLSHARGARLKGRHHAEVKFGNFFPFLSPSLSCCPWIGL